MLTLYHCANARSFRPLWTLEELGLPYDLRMLPFPPRFLKREYLELNPLGTIPLLIDGETRMTESAAICQYLVTRYGPSPLAVTADEPAYGAFLNWLHFGEATLTFPQTIYFRYAQLEPDERKNPQAAADYARWFLARLRGRRGRRIALRNHLCRTFHGRGHLGRLRADVRAIQRTGCAVLADRQRILVTFAGARGLSSGHRVTGSRRHRTKRSGHQLDRTTLLG